MKTIKHYLMGLMASAWNGGISSVSAILGIDAVAMTGAEQVNRVLNAHEMGSAFIGACVIHGVMWLKAHPIPEDYNTKSATQKP